MPATAPLPPPPNPVPNAWTVPAPQGWTGPAPAGWTPPAPATWQAAGPPGTWPRPLPPWGYPVAPPSPPRPSWVARSRSLVSENAELLGWGGVVLTVFGALWATADLWRGDLGLTVVLAIATAGTAAGAAVFGRAAEVVERDGGDDATARRLAAAMWVGASVLAPLTVYLGLRRLAGLDVDPALLAAGVTVTGMGGWAWARTRGTAGHLVTFAGAALTLVGLAGTVGGGPDATAVGLYLLALVWAAGCAADVLRPARSAYGLSAATALGAAQALVFAGYADVGLVLGMIATTGAVAAASRTREALPVSLAVLAAVVFVPQAVGRWLGDILSAPTLVLLGGLVMVGASAQLVRRATRAR